EFGTVFAAHRKSTSGNPPYLICKINNKLKKCFFSLSFERKSVYLHGCYNNNKFNTGKIILIVIN
ncbi:MAG: hypothetical protein SPL77_04845, partial [Prevotella sp.]|nr:hypothetical protein [Prevotella sp.]